MQLYCVDKQVPNIYVHRYATFQCVDYFFGNYIPINITETNDKSIEGTWLMIYSGLEQVGILHMILILDTQVHILRT